MPSKDWSAGLVRDPKTDHIIIRFKDPHWQQKTTPYRWSVSGDEARALKLAAQKERQVKERKAFADASGSVTVRSFGEKWIVGRKGNTSCVDDEQRLEDYVYPAIGHMLVDDVRPRHLVAMLKALGKRKSRKGGTLAPKTIRNAYAACCALFHGAVMEELVTYRSANHMLKKFHQDLARLKSDKQPEGLRLRRQHDARRTWLSMVLAAGANETHAKWIAHGPPPTVLADYTTMPWETLCLVTDGLRSVGAKARSA